MVADAWLGRGGRDPSAAPGEQALVLDPPRGRRPPRFQQRVELVTKLEREVNFVDSLNLLRVRLDAARNEL
eukprot:748101-Prymnesium_polylepis.2